MLRKIAQVTLAAGLVAAIAGPALADVNSTPPAGFKKVSELVKLPYFMPGYGTLYVDPKTLPVGPFLGYGHNNKLADIVFMVPLKDLNSHKNWTDLATTAVAGVKVNHVDVMFNPGHPGVEVPHYHVILSTIPHSAESKDLK